MTHNRPLRELMGYHTRQYAPLGRLALVRHDGRSNPTATTYRSGDRTIVVGGRKEPRG